MNDVAIRVEGLGKSYRLRHERSGGAGYRTLREELLGLPRRLRGKREGKDATGEEFWALRDVSFEIKPGEVFGIIGRNGAGKSTLLKILSRITEPTCGQIDLYGRVGSLLEVGTGFHPELTGRENIFLNGAILGMRRPEIRRRFDEIVAFAGVEKFLDTPCKHYSSGMYMRLGFAVAAHLDAEILLVDEVLAVGDAEFQRKCSGKMGEVAGSGRTVVLVSHNMAALQNLCPQSLLLWDGRAIARGESQEVVRKYLRSGAAISQVLLAERQDRTGSGRLKIHSVRFAASDGGQPASGMPLSILVDYMAKADSRLGKVRFAFLFRSVFGEPIFTCDTFLTGADFTNPSLVGTVVCRLAVLPITEGSYRMNVWSTVDGEVADFVEDAATLVVQEGDFFGTGRNPIPRKNGPLLVAQDWNCVPRS